MADRERRRQGTELAVAAPAASDVGRKIVKLVTFTKGTAETTSPAVRGKPIYEVVSYYSHDTKTASGERFDARELTAAHRTLPFGTRVRVTSLDTGRRRRFGSTTAAPLLADAPSTYPAPLRNRSASLTAVLPR